MPLPCSAFNQIYPSFKPRLPPWNSPVLTQVYMRPHHPISCTPPTISKLAFLASFWETLAVNKENPCYCSKRNAEHKAVEDSPASVTLEKACLSLFDPPPCHPLKCTSLIPCGQCFKIGTIVHILFNYGKNPSNHFFRFTKQKNRQKLNFNFNISG